MKQKHIAILDFGSQYTHLISRRIRQLGVLSKIYPTDVNAHDLKDDVWGIVLSGGPNSVTDEKLPYDPGIFTLKVPILGLCYGHQLFAHHLKGKVEKSTHREYGKATLTVLDTSSLFKGLSETEQVWMSHGDSVVKAPRGFTVIGTTQDGSITAMANEKRKWYGLQFHVEVNHTTNGLTILKNFVFDICGAQANWSMEEYLQELEQELKVFVKKQKVFMLVSGGVDSSVAFALLERILGKERVYGLHIDNGFMRLNESMMVKNALAKAGFDNLHVVNATDRFLKAVKGVTDPETKRKIIGKMFLDVQKDVFKKLGFNEDEWLLGQGTIYPDTIETGGTSASDTIKTHHNRVDEVVEMINQGKVIEPLAALYKDEVRDIGKQLRLPAPLIERWPFPGPGLSIRVLCSDGKEVAIENEAEQTAQLNEFVAPLALEGRIMPVRSVGVQGDERSYRHPAVLFGKKDPDWAALNDVSVRITNSIRGVNRVVLHVGGRVDFSRMSLKEGYLTKERLDVLRLADKVSDDVVRKHNLAHEIWQFPVILLPLTFGASDETIVLRPIESREAMTVNFYPMDVKIMQEIVRRIMKIDGVGAVFYDVTNKPPATIEWE